MTRLFQLHEALHHLIGYPTAPCTRSATTRTTVAILPEHRVLRGDPLGAPGGTVMVSQDNPMGLEESHGE